MTASHSIPPAPRASVLMTTYNGARFIAESIDSVLAQDFNDFELVVVDDASTDATAAILAGYTDPRLRVIRNTSNLGVVGARNRGFAELRGTYVAPIDHDDLWRPARLAEGVARLDRDPATVLVATQIMILTDKGLFPSDRPIPSSSVLFRWMLLMDCPVSYSSLLFRRDAARRSDGTFMRPELRYADDYELMLRLASLGDMVALTAPLTVYRVHDNNTTWHVRDEMYRHALIAVEEQFTPWLGIDAAEAAQLITWHIARRQPVPDRPTLLRLGVLLRQLLDAFVTALGPEPEDRQRIEMYARRAYWRALRASIRSGRVWLLVADWGGAARAVHASGAAGDAVASLLAGFLRLPARVLLSDRGRPAARR